MFVTLTHSFIAHCHIDESNQAKFYKGSDYVAHIISFQDCYTQCEQSCVKEKLWLQEQEEVTWRAKLKRCIDSSFDMTRLKSFSCRWPNRWFKDNLTLPTPVVPVNMTDLLIASSFSIRKPNRTVSTVGTSRSKYGISELYLNEGMIFSHGSRRRVSKSTK